MIFRLADCGICDSLREIGTVVWISASSHEDARRRAVAALAVTWNVSADRVCVQDVRDEIDLHLSSIQDSAAGDRRLLECGNGGGVPFYLDPKTMLVFLGDKDRRR